MPARERSCLSEITYSYCLHSTFCYIDRVKTVRYLRDAQAALRRHGNVAGRLRRAMREYAENPAAHANKLAQLVGQAAKRMRVGNYRIVFEETDMELVVTKIGPRGDIYC